RRARNATPEPSVAVLLSIDVEYRRKAVSGRLLQVAPTRMNPTGAAWLPILHTTRAGRRYTALYSNTPLAHELGTTHDWVVIYREGAGDHDQWTIVTATHGPDQGRRMIRGREGECSAHHARGTERGLFS